MGGCTNSPAVTKKIWRFAIEEVDGSVQDAYAKKFAELISEKSRGEIEVRIYPYGTLGTSDQITEQVATGAIQLAMSSPGHLGKLIPELQVFSLHFLFSGDEEVNRKLFRSDGKLVDLFSDKYSAKGFELLGFYPEGWQIWTTNKLIRKPEDFSGFKMRVMTSPLLLEIYRTYGANPVPLPYGEVYSALQLKMIDGQVNPAFAIEEMSFYEVTDYMIFPKASMFVTSAITSKRFLKRLPADQRKWLKEASAESVNYIFAKQQDYNKSRLEKIRNSRDGDVKMIELTKKERRRFLDKSKKSLNVFYDIGGDDAKRIYQDMSRVIQELEDNG